VSPTSFRKPHQDGFLVPRGAGLQLMQFNNPASTKNMTTLYLRKSMCRLPSRRGFPVVLLALAALFTLSPVAQAVTPAPDGGYPNQNTAGQ